MLMHEVHCIISSPFQQLWVSEQTDDRHNAIYATVMLYNLLIEHVTVMSMECHHLDQPENT